MIRRPGAPVSVGVAGVALIGARGGAEAGRSLWGDAWHRLLRNRAAAASLGFLVLLGLLAALAPLIAPYPPEAVSFGQIGRGPSQAHPLGTDELGRDMLSRMLFGARVSLTLGLTVQALAIGLGITLGLIAGYYRGPADMILMRLVDLMHSLPAFLFAMLMVSVLPRTVLSLVIILALAGWTFTARLVRGQVLSVERHEYITAARTLGAPGPRIMLLHILPNILSPIIVEATLGIAGTIIAEAGLSFLGIGIPPPEPSWGSMINKGRSYLRTFPHLALFPSIALALTVLAFNFLGDGLRDALDPRQKR